MVEDPHDEHREIKTKIVGLYNILFEDSISRRDIELYELESEDEEGEIFLPYIGLNVDLWREWSMEKRIEVLVHEFAHTENYDDDHHPDFWDRVVELTEIAIAHPAEIENLFDEELDPEELKSTIVDSIHEYVIETEIDSVAARRRDVRGALDLSTE